MADPVLYIANDRYGYEPKPNQYSNRLFVPIYINDLGLRDNENFSSLEDNHKVILILGDSVTYGGSRIKQEDLFTEVLENKLQNHSSKIKVLNAGVNGYSITQMINRGENLIEKIHPDYVIIYTIINDYSRPPLTFIHSDNFVYPMKRPISAFADFLLLSIRYLDKRYHFSNLFPNVISKVIDVPHNLTPAYDEDNIIKIHLQAVENFAKYVFGSKIGIQNSFIIFFSPNKTDLVEYSESNIKSFILSSFEQMHITKYDLRNDFYRKIINKGEDVDVYYWDELHYTKKGHHLAGEILYNYVVDLIK